MVAMDQGDGIEFPPVAKNKAAQELGRRGGRALAKKLPREAFRELGQRGGKKRWAGISEEEKSRLMAKIRRARKRRKK